MGLIHSDIHSGNCVFAKDGIGVIDFEDCGIGYYLYDLAVVLDEVIAKYPEHVQEYQQELLKNYRRHYSLFMTREQFLPVFVAMQTGLSVLNEGRGFLRETVDLFGGLS